MADFPFPKSNKRVTRRDFLDGVDPQGIPWGTEIIWTRDAFREHRRNTYRNFANFDNISLSDIDDITPSEPNLQDYGFWNAWRINTGIEHLQLRHLGALPTEADLYVSSEHRVVHVNMLSGLQHPVLDLRTETIALHPVGISTVTCGQGLLAAGGLFSELVVRRMEPVLLDDGECWEIQEEGRFPGKLPWVQSSARPMQLTDPDASRRPLTRRAHPAPARDAFREFSTWEEYARSKPKSPAAFENYAAKEPHEKDIISTMQNADDVYAMEATGSRIIKNRGLNDPSLLLHDAKITGAHDSIINSLQITNLTSGAQVIFAACNDDYVRVLDTEQWKQVTSIQCPWRINNAQRARQDPSALALVGDDQVGKLYDMRAGRFTADLAGHRDYTFALDWSVDDRYVATGNQDKTCRVFDVRNTKNSVYCLAGDLGSIRQVRFSEDGARLMTVEGSDYIHVYDVTSDFKSQQRLEVIGDISFASFSPSRNSLVACVVEANFGAIMEWRLNSLLGKT